MNIQNGVFVEVYNSDIVDGKVIIPDSVIDIGYCAFYGCTSLKEVVMPDSVTEIGDYAFFGCTLLEKVIIPDSVTNIGHSSFENCTSLKEVVIPNSVTSIGYYAFENCTSLEKVIIPNSVTRIGYCAFNYCTSLKKVNNKKAICIDGYPMIITSQKRLGEYTIIKGYFLEGINKEDKPIIFVAQKDGFNAHGETVEKAIEDVNLKILSEKIKNEPIFMDTLITIQKYRAITCSCQLGVEKWLQDNNLTDRHEMSVRELLPILEKTNAYGIEKFKSLIKD